MKQLQGMQTGLLFSLTKTYGSFMAISILFRFSFYKAITGSALKSTLTSTDFASLETHLLDPLQLLTSQGSHELARSLALVPVPPTGAWKCLVPPCAGRLH